MMSKSAVTPAKPQEVTVLRTLWRKVAQIAHSGIDLYQALSAFHHGRCYSQLQNNLLKEGAVVSMCCTDVELGH